MIITCPACQNRYTADLSQMGPERRKVRCAGCKHVWELMNTESEAPRRMPPPPQDISVARIINPKRVAITLILLMMAGSIVGRAAIVSYWPAMHEFYASLGLSTQRPGAALRIIQPAAFFVPPNHTKATQMIVSGTILNTSNQTQILPPLEITAHHQAAGPGSSSAVLKKWRHRLAHSRLLPKESITFELHKTLPSGAPAQITLGF